MGSIAVVGLAGRSADDDWDHLIAGRVVFVRHSGFARSATPPGCTFTHAFDDVLDGDDVTSMAETIVDEILTAAETQEVAYLVPGTGSAGDVTVERLTARRRISVQPGELSVPFPCLHNVQIVDALALAEAEAARPFDAGLVPLDAGVRTVGFNWYGDQITSLAARRLQRTYADTGMYVQSGMLILEPRAPGDDGASFAGFLQTVARLRRPDGCPWDRKQTHASLLDGLREEIDEVSVAVERGDWENLAEELGDVLLHVAMQAQVASEAGTFTIEDVISGVSAKLVRRHPHVFGDASAGDVDDVLSIWQQAKRTEKLARRRREV